MLSGETVRSTLAIGREKDIVEELTRCKIKTIRAVLEAGKKRSHCGRTHLV